MGLAIKSIKIGPSQKRVDAQVEFTSIWHPDYIATFRIVSRQEIGEEKAIDLVNQMHKKRKEWKEGKKNMVCPLDGVNATGYIINLEYIERKNDLESYE